MTKEIIQTLASLPHIARVSAWEDGNGYVSYDHLTSGAVNNYGNVFIRDDGSIAVSALVGQDRRDFIKAATDAGIAVVTL
jgi:hypothetical protein